jgi:hypothetical protein
MVLMISSRTNFDGERVLYAEIPVLEWTFNDCSPSFPGEGLLMSLFEIVSPEDWMLE